MQQKRQLNDVDIGWVTGIRTEELAQVNNKQGEKVKYNKESNIYFNADVPNSRLSMLLSITLRRAIKIHCFNKNFFI